MKCCPDCNAVALDIHEEIEMEEVSYEHGDCIQFVSKFPEGLPGDVYCEMCREYFWYEELNQTEEIIYDYQKSR